MKDTLPPSERSARITGISVSDLGRFHADRASRYERVASLLARLTAAPGEAGAGESARLVQTLLCNDPAADRRREALQSAAVAGSGSRADEIDALARLARRTASALEAGHLDGALHLIDLQWALLADHAARCLGELADWLESSRPDGGAVAATLRDALARDRDLLWNGETPLGNPPDVRKR